MDNSIFNKRNIRIAVVVITDIIMTALASGLAVLSRWDFSFANVPLKYLELWHRVLPIQILITIVVYALFKMYRFVWRQISAGDVMEMVGPVVLAYALCVVAEVLIGIDAGYRMPISVVVINFLYQFIFVIGMRSALRFIGVIQNNINRSRLAPAERIMIIGAGDAANQLLREYQSSDKVAGKVCCLIDDNRVNHGKRLEGVPIIGGRDAIKDAVKKYEITQIIFAIPSASAQQKKEILEICKDTGCQVKSLPGIYQLVNGEVSIEKIKDVDIADLLGREQAHLNTEMLDAFLRDKVILVTGGGGSIGSELCRQIAPYEPKQLIILDIYENNAYDIQQELIRKYRNTLNLAVEIASVRDKDKIDLIFEKYRPEIVIHAAAHKHVPLMETCPDEAIKNNIFGTYNVASAADRYGVQKFVLISTDKAVNPTNLMGASKRFCEMILNSFADSSTSFSAVRFGNVLGSNGSVVPLFKAQILAGGPVTITDKRITRFFMTGEEATQLVLTCGAMAKRNQIFVLDMGQPVKIIDMAENLIRLSGHEPYTEIEIVEIGLRPGEKLYEELLMQTGNLDKTENNKIFVEQQGVRSKEELENDLRILHKAIDDKVSNEECIALMKTLVPTYKSPVEINDHGRDAPDI